MQVIWQIVNSIFTKLCNHYHYLIAKHFHYSKKKKNLTPHSSVLQSWSTTDLFSVSLNLPVLHIPYKWNHMCPLCLASFTYHNGSRCISAVTCISALFLFNGWITFHCVGISQSAYPFISWWMFCFHLLAIRNNAVTDICVQVFVWKCVFNSLGNVPRIAISGSYGNFICFEELPNCFAKWLRHFTFLPANLWGFLHMLVNTCFVYLSD